MGRRLRYFWLDFEYKFSHRNRNSINIFMLTVTVPAAVPAFAQLRQSSLWMCNDVYLPLCEMECEVEMEFSEKNPRKIEEKKNTSSRENWSKESVFYRRSTRKEVSEKSIETAANENGAHVHLTTNGEGGMDRHECQQPTVCALRLATQKWNLKFSKREDIRSLLRCLSFVLRCRCREKSI